MATYTVFIQFNKHSASAQKTCTDTQPIIKSNSVDNTKAPMLFDVAGHPFHVDTSTRQHLGLILFLKKKGTNWHSSKTICFTRFSAKHGQQPYVFTRVSVKHGQKPYVFTRFSAKNDPKSYVFVCVLNS